VLLWVNEAARRRRILPGLRYAAAMALDPDLRAGVVADDEIEARIAALTGRLWSFSPRVEPAAGEPGVFWLDGKGLMPLYRSHAEWAACLRAGLVGAGYRAAVAVGFSRFGSYATARSLPAGGLQVFPTPAAEAAYCRGVPLERLALPPKLRDRLAGLGVHCLGEFLALPIEGMRRRLGAPAEELHRRARGIAEEVWTPVTQRPPLLRRLILDRPDADLERLLAAVAALLAPLLLELRRHGESVRRLDLSLLLDDGKSVQHALEPAAPTLDERQLLDLVALRLSGESLSAGVVEVGLEVGGIVAAQRQTELFTRPPRDLAAARRALARLRAAFGEGAVVCARLQEGHLPEACFALDKLYELDAASPFPSASSSPAASPFPSASSSPAASPFPSASPSPAASPAGPAGPARSAGPARPARPAALGASERPLVRRIFLRPSPLPFRSRHEPDGWHLTSADGPVDEVMGPYRVCGGWWLREVARDYYYVRTRSGRWLWIYHDRQRRRWMLQGEVE
jgi:protein ImuB